MEGGDGGGWKKEEKRNKVSGLKRILKSQLLNIDASLRLCSYGQFSRFK